MAIERKWAIMAVFVSVIVVLCVVIPIAVNSGKGNSAAPAQLAVSGADMAPESMLLQFGKMIKCMVRNNPLKYHGYGCHCGLLRSSAPTVAPVDETDRCCQTHHMCLMNLQAQGTCQSNIVTINPLVIPYSMNIEGCKGPGMPGKGPSGRPDRPGRGNGRGNGRGRPRQQNGPPSVSIECTAPANYTKMERILAFNNLDCAAAVCECDRQAAMCFSEHTLDKSFFKGNMNNSTLCEAGGQGGQGGQGTGMPQPQPTFPAGNPAGTGMPGNPGVYPGGNGAGGYPGGNGAGGNPNGGGFRPSFPPQPPTGFPNYPNNPNPGNPALWRQGGYYNNYWN